VARNIQTDGWHGQRGWQWVVKAMRSKQQLKTVFLKVINAVADAMDSHARDIFMRRMEAQDRLGIILHDYRNGGGTKMSLCPK
jgi:hypothetical protein